MATFSPRSRSRSSGAAKCCVCLDRLNLADTLPCDHRYCHDCINHQMSRLAALSDSFNNFSIVCPYCRDFLLAAYANRTNQPYKSTGYTSSKYPIKAHETGSRSERSVLGGKQQRCEPCAEGKDYSVATCWCHQCSEYLCSSCARFHRSMKMSKDHFVKTIRDKEKYEKVKSRAFDTVPKSARASSAADRRTPLQVRPATPSGEDDHACEPCGSRRKKAGALYWCDNCNEKLCEECSQCHRSMKMSKMHTLMRMNDLLKSGSNFSVGIQCERHDGEVLSLFCKRCRCSCCSICAITVHSNCGAPRKLSTSKAPKETSKPMETGLALYMKNMQVSKQGVHSTKGTIFSEKEPNDKTVSFGLKPSIKTASKEAKEAKCQIPKNRMEMRKTRLEFGNPTEGDWVTSIAVLGNGDILIIEMYQSDLKMFDSSANFLSNCEFNGNPWAVAVYKDSLAAVTFSDKNLIQLVNITGAGLQTGRKLSTRHKSLGICFANDNIVISSWDGSIRVMNIAGRELFSVHNDVYGDPLFSSPEYLAADALGQTIYVSDFKRNTITALPLLPNELGNRPLWVFRDKDLNGPKGITVDKTGVIYVSGMTSRNIFRLAPDGKLIQVYRRRQDVDYYEAMAITSTGDRLLVSAYQDATIIKFKLTK